MPLGYPGGMDLPPPPAPHVTRRRVLRGMVGGGLTLGALGGAGVAQAIHFGVVRERARVPGLRAPLRVALLTDLHYGLYVFAPQVRAWVDAANAERPDLILLGGDLLDTRSGGATAPLTAELARLRAPLGVYAVWGNHDYGSFGFYGTPWRGPAQPDWARLRKAFRAALASAGVTLLQNGGRSLREDLHLGGVDDLWHGQPDVGRALSGAGERATLLLSHNPDVLPDLPRPVGLTLCGHTHGGQVRLPVVGAFMVPSRYGQRYAMGWVRGAHGSPAYVSRGLGTSGVPFRNLCTPEITLLTLTG